MNNREAFEAWYAKEMDSGADFFICDTGFYDCMKVQIAWRGYQACLASQAQQPTKPFAWMQLVNGEPLRSVALFEREKQGMEDHIKLTYPDLKISWVELFTAAQLQAQQTESQWINLKKDDYSHLKGNELIYAYGIGCGIFEAYLKDYEVVREDMFNRNTSEVTHIMVRIPVSLPPAPEGGDK